MRRRILACIEGWERYWEPLSKLLLGGTLPGQLASPAPGYSESVQKEVLVEPECPT